MIEISAEISLEESELSYAFTHAGGPGGQHANKTSSAVQLRFDVANSPSLPNGVRRRLIEQAGNRMTNDGILVIDARQSRSQTANKVDALNRLRELIRSAEKKPKKRRKTKPSKAAKARRLDAKKRHSNKKKNRQKQSRDEY